MAAGNLDDALSQIPNVVVVDQSAATAAPGAGYARIEAVNGVLGVRVGTGAWTALASLVAGLLDTLTEKATPIAGDLLLLQDEADSSALKKVDVANLPGGTGGGLHDAYARYTNYLAGASHGGTATAGAWTDRPINTEDWDPSSIGSLASNHVTLGAGTYYVRGYACYQNCDQCMVRLYDVTHSAVLAISGVGSAASTDATGIMVPFAGRFTLAEESALAVQYRVQTTRADWGLGQSCPWSDSHNNLSVEFWREA